MKNRKITEVLGIDLGSTSTKLVRIRRSGSGYSLVDADVLPALEPEQEIPLELDKKHQISYVAACVTGRESVVRFVDIPARYAGGRAADNRLRKQIGLAPDFRIGYAITRPPKASETEVKVLAVGMPDVEIQRLKKWFPGMKPSLVSAEVSSLAALHSFEKTPEANPEEGIVCYIEAGAEVSTISFITEGTLLLTRKFEYGGNDLNRRIQELLNVDEEGALTVLYDDPAALEEAPEAPMASFLRQIAISRQFVERSENKSLAKVYVSGGLSYSAYWLGQIQAALEAEIGIWNPFTGNGMSAYPRGIQGVESMFSPAVGCALAVLQGADA